MTGRCLHDYDSELLMTAVLTLRGLTQGRMTAGSLLASLCLAYRDSPAPRLERDLSGFADDLCAAYAAHVSPRAGPVRPERPGRERQYLRWRLIALLQRALDDQRGISRAPHTEALGGPER